MEASTPFSSYPLAAKAIFIAAIRNHVTSITETSYPLLLVTAPVCREASSRSRRSLRFVTISRVVGAFRCCMPLALLIIRGSGRGTLEEPDAVATSLA